jgi:hypothetical protein
MEEDPPPLELDDIPGIKQEVLDDDDDDPPGIELDLPFDDDMDWVESTSSLKAEDIMAQEVNDLFSSSSPPVRHVPDESKHESPVDYFVRTTVSLNSKPFAAATELRRAASAPSNVSATRAKHVIETTFEGLRLCMPTNKGVMSSSSAAADLETYDRNLPLYTAQHETELLVQAGTRPMGHLKVTLPPCSLLDSCVGKTHASLIQGMPPGGFVLMCAMSPDQFKTLVESNRPPSVLLPCILCMRYMQGLLVENISTGETILPMNVVIQTYKNEKDTESGYLAPLMHMPSSDPWNGLRQPVARFLPSALTAYQDPLNGLWRINQDPMRFFRRAGAAF